MSTNIQADQVLYHFTAVEFLDDIRTNGLTPRPLCIPDGKFSPPVVSLTANPDPKRLIGRSLTDGSVLEGVNLAAYRASLNDPTAAAPHTRRTCECRIRLRLPISDPHLSRLKDVADGLGFSDLALADFLRLGGCNGSAWWIYEGVLSPTAIEEIRCGYPRYGRPV